MSQRSRQRLAMDAEKLYAAHQLWLQHNEFLKYVIQINCDFDSRVLKFYRAGHAHSILHEAVFAYMEVVGEQYHEDCVRAFFRLRVDGIGELLLHVADILRRNHHNLSYYISEANQTILVSPPRQTSRRFVLTLHFDMQTVLRSAVGYREYNQGVYGIDLPLINAWTSQPSIIDVVSESLKNTTSLIESPSADAETASARVELKAQVPDLASTLFTCIQERLDWLGRCVILQFGNHVGVKLSLLLSQSFGRKRTWCGEGALGPVRAIPTAPSRCPRRLAYVSSYLPFELSAE